MGVGVAPCYQRRPFGDGSELLVVVLVNPEYAQLFLHHQISHYRFIYGGQSYAV